MLFMFKQTKALDIGMRKPILRFFYGQTNVFAYGQTKVFARIAMVDCGGGVRGLFIRERGPFCSLGFPVI
ncbi:Uncharacterised protein [Candidatus Bartonella washoeensis]|nr:Uncharacterised protein [Bartonella washoeensis]